MKKKRKMSKSRTKLKRNIFQKKPLLFVLLFAVVGCVSLVITLAAPPSKDQLGFQTGAPTTGTRKYISQPVDWLTWCNDCYAPGTQHVIDYKTQDPWVTNPTQCMWDTDDYYEYSTTGSSLSPGTSAGFNECSYESTSEATTPNPNTRKNNVMHAAFFNISAPSPNLKVTKTFSWDGGSQTFIATPVLNPTSKRYEYKQCMIVNSVANGQWAAVPGSNGGYGVPVTITTTVSNPTSRTISKIGGYVRYGWQQFYGAGCKANFPPPLGT